MKLFKRNKDDKEKEKEKKEDPITPSSPSSSSTTSSAPTKKKRNVFVVVSQKENYYTLLNGVELTDGSVIEVDQAPWLVASYSDSNPTIHIKPNRNPFPYSNQGHFRTFAPDFVLLRSYILGNHEHDWRKKMYAFYHADTPTINSLDSFVWSIEKAVMYGKLRRVKKRDPSFPLVPEVYYSAPSVGSFPPDFPAVLKVGSSSQGVGKAMIDGQNQWRDALSLLAMTKDEYFITEPYMEWKTDVRVQKIGNHYRAIQRTRTASNTAWKANDAIGIIEADCEITPAWRKWVDEAAEELGMDMCGMDIISDGEKEYILEVNSSSIGFPDRHRAEDMSYVKELIVEKLNALIASGQLK